MCAPKKSRNKNHRFLVFQTGTLFLAAVSEFNTHTRKGTSWCIQVHLIKFEIYIALYVSTPLCAETRQHAHAFQSVVKAGLSGGVKLLLSY